MDCSQFDATRYRHWIKLNNVGPVKKEDCFTIMSYNLLSRHYMWNQVFGYLDQSYLNWTDYRFPLINKTIQQFQCDIMCFQEMECSIYDSYWSMNFPSSKYASFYMKKSLPEYWAGRPTDFIDGVGIFVNTARFDVLDCKKINFGDYLKTNAADFEMTQDLITRVVSRNTVAIILKLYDRISGKDVYVATTHLYWSPKYNDVKVMQTKLLLNILQKFVDVPNPYIILMGDLNSNSESLVFKLLDSHQDPHHAISLSGRPEFNGYDYGTNNQLVNKNNAIENQFCLMNIYEEVLNHKKLNFTSFTKSLTDVLDHMFVSHDKFSIVKMLSEVDPTYCMNEKVIGFPNNEFPSDHIPLVAELCYK
ncbi:glucose-repressible alcohol dehydrogenase transcriptional effector [Scheffersomyces xylosifermentans]|uniref:glucose-repressible alcohol dehydrogenase transcriptional effector n=1 Tax=Scheffersomyces xylosifermentans TaxID=1304137 RepID=UPI00315DB6D5